MAGMNWPTARSSSSPIPTVSAGPGTSAAAAGGQDARTSTTSHFINAVVDDIAGHVTIDPKRRYATGISNGGMLAYALACNTGTFAAIGPDSATQLDKCAAPHPTSVMHIHGTADPRIRYDGDPGSGVATPDGGPSIPDLNAFWRNVDRCASPATTTDGAITTSTADCPDGRSVVLITVDGGGHEWPSFATQALWQFFAAF
jgi:polyhydroxybutyrate depolymerase